MIESNCTGSHHYFVADVVGVPAEGTLSIVVVCTSCGDSFSKTFDVAKPLSVMQLKSETNKEKH